MLARSPIHANNAAVGIPRLEALRFLATSAEQLAKPDFYRSFYPDLLAEVECARARLAELLACDSAQICLETASTSAAIGLFLHACRLQKGDVIAVSRGVFVSVRLAVEPLRRMGIEIEFVGDADGTVLAEHLAQVKGRLRLAIVDWVDYRTGVRNDPGALADWCSSANVLLLLDAAQAVGTVGLDFDTARVAAIVFPGHKWLRGIEGVGVLYVSRHARAHLRPTIRGYRSLRTPFDFSSRRIAGDSRGLEVGTLNHLGICALGRSVAWLLQYGPFRQARDTCLQHDLLQKRLRALNGVHVITPQDPNRRAGILSLSHVCPPEVVVKRLADVGVIAGQRAGYVRLSPVPETDAEDLGERVERALATLS